MSGRAVAAYRADDAVICNLTDTMVPGIGNIKVLCCIQLDIGGMVDRCYRNRAVNITGVTVAHYRSNYTGRRNLPDPLIAIVGYEYIAGVVYAYADGNVEQGVGARCIPEARLLTAGQQTYVLISVITISYLTAAGFGDIQDAAGIERNACRLAEFGIRSYSIYITIGAAGIDEGAF